METEMRRALLVALTVAVLLPLQTATSISAQGPDALRFFKNYFITGDYLVRGVGLRGKGVDGLAAGSIILPTAGQASVPAGGDVVAAFLYWQVVAKDTLGPDAGSAGVTFNGYRLSTPEGPFGKVLDQAGTAPCWSSGGGTGSSAGVHKTYSYRADVLRFMKIDPSTGKTIASGPHAVQIPDAGPSGNSGPIALGASLVVVYKDSSLPLSAIVLYDGGFTLDNSNRTMTQAIKGFYQQAATPDARISYIVGSGQANKNELVYFNGGLLATNPFGGSEGASWDNPTFSVSLPTTLPEPTQVTTSIGTLGVNGADCLSPAALVFKTAVKDTDADGLVDAWESSTSLQDPNGQPLPVLSLMGASPHRKDVFYEVGYMHTGGANYSYGGVEKPAHSHLPSHEVLKKVGDALGNAPVLNPDGTRGISAHFDVGHSYPTGEADRYIIRGIGLARGGEAIDEKPTGTACTRSEGDPPWVCQFSAYPGTVGWKTGFRFIRDEVIGDAPAPAPQDADVCDPPGNDGPGQSCERRFDRNRKAIFHYALFAHAVGLPRSELPCLDQDGAPVASVDGACALKENPDFRVPRTITGVGDFAGGDALVTLGAFPDHGGRPVGTPFMQASTWLHEFGHNGERRHGGDASELNCKPTYLSVMNYLYQLRGLLDDRGRPHLDFSSQEIDAAPGFPVNERLLTDGVLSMLPYRIGWYAPLAGSYLAGMPGVHAARAHCDGSPLMETDVPTVRIDARTAAAAIDWNADGTDQAGYALDVNFNGRTTRPSNGAAELLPGSNDWLNIKLNQIGSRRSVGGQYLDHSGRLALGPLSLDAGRSDYGRSDYGRSDYGRSDYGRSDYGDFSRGDLGRSDYGRSDYGRSDYGRGDEGRGDLGGGDLFANDPDNPGGELDFETAQDLARTPPNEFSACVIGVDCAAETTPLHKGRLDWKAPHVGGVLQYTVYRVDGAVLAPGVTWTEVRSVFSIAGQTDYSTVDAAELVNGADYTYFAVAVYGDGVQSDPSNLVTIRAVNVPPVAGSDSYTMTQGGVLTVAAPGVLGNDSDSDSTLLTAALASGPSNGTLTLDANGSFTYTPVAGFVGTDMFAYRAVAGGQSSAPIPVSITVTGQRFGFVNVQNLPPPAGKAFNVGSSVPLQWRFTLADAVFNSGSVLPEIVVTTLSGSVVYNGNPTDPGSSSFQRPTAANGYTWHFNWQTKGLTKGTYHVYVGSLATGQVYGAGAFGPFPISLK